jgi:formate hydrogenlyase transcriptional activator
METRTVEDALIAAARALTSRLDVTGAASAVLDALQEIFGARSSWILLCDGQRQQLETIAFRGPDAEAYRGVVMPADAGVMGLAFNSRRMVFVPDARQDDRWFDTARVRRTGLQSVFAVPLLHQDRAIGVIGLDAPQFTVTNRPQEIDVARLEALAAQAAIAIVNAQLYEASERDRRRLAALLQERRGLRRRVSHLQEEVRAAYALGELVGDSEAWTEVVRQVDLVAPGDTTALLLGETGTGKELLARRLHDRSARASGPFVAVNCAALPEALVESELFGHEKGAFTGAISRKAGRFEVADGGTLFLDEIGDLPPEAQAKLLRVLQDSRVQRIGGTQSIVVDVRVIAATNQDLESATAARTFRSDLYYRLSVFPIAIPPLRARAEDIPVLARHFLEMFARKLRRPAERLSDAAMKKLLSYPWPGNVRELQNVVERAVILSGKDTVQAESIWLPQLPASVRPRESEPVVTLVEAERRAILAALDDTGWRISGAGGAADRLDMKPTTLHAKLKKLGIRRPSRRGPSAK